MEDLFLNIVNNQAPTASLRLGLIVKGVGRFPSSAN